MLGPSQKFQLASSPES